MNDASASVDNALTLTRIIRAPRAAVWRAWTEPALLERWWTPAPYVTRVEQLDVRPGGAFVTHMTHDGGKTFVPHTDGVFIVAEIERRILFTNAVTSAWYPASPQPVAITGEFQLLEHAEGTEYVATARHLDAQQSARHVELGFHEGWGAVIESLAELAEGLER